VELYEAMTRHKPIVFRSVVLVRSADGVSILLTFEGVRNLFSNLSFIVDVAQCRSSNEKDTFASLVGPGKEDVLNSVTRSALKAAAPFAEVDLSRLDAFVLGEGEPLLSAPQSEVPDLLRAAAACGYYEALNVLLFRKPDAEALRSALYQASRCGRAQAVQTLLLVGATADCENEVRRPQRHTRVTRFLTPPRFFYP